MTSSHDDDNGGIRRHVLRADNVPHRSQVHLVVACIMFACIVFAGVMLDRAGREPEAIIATLSFYSATAIGITTAIAKLSGVEQTTATVEKRTNGEFRTVVRDEVRIALREVMPGPLNAPPAYVPPTKGENT